MSSTQVTSLLSKIASGDVAASEELFPLIYADLRRMAKRHLRNERASHTLDPTGLVHEAYLRMVGTPSVQWVDAGHFFAIASTAMRRILVEHARAKNRFKRGGKLSRVPLEDLLAGGGLVSGVSTGSALTSRATLGDFGACESDRLGNSDYVLALEEGLKRLESVDPTAVEVIELRFFAGLTIDQTAEALGISSRSVCRSWTFARSWLYREIFDNDADNRVPHDPVPKA